MNGPWSASGWPALSVIIPLGPEEQERPPLFDDLGLLPPGSEILLVGCHASAAVSVSRVAVARPPTPHLRVRRLRAQQGRATQMNLGAERATGEYLWFLHADTRLTAENVSALRVALRAHPDSLLYFDLGFHDGGQRRLRLNQWGARLRSDWLGVPFGDQGLCLPSQRFAALGGYPASAPYGEDHLLVWRARQQGIRLAGIGSRLATSARKYRQHGWLRLTLRYQWMWLCQAWPEWKTLLAIRLGLRSPRG